LIKSGNSLLNPPFSHIYVEKDVLSHENTLYIIGKFKKASIIEVDSYKDIFSRPRQDFQLQKKAPKLIVAKKHPPYYYELPELCQRYDDNNYYYTSSILNCVYNCHYCFLQGMHPSANLVVFVNIEDYFESLIGLNKSLNSSDSQENPYSKKITLSVSYDSDLPALENIFPFTHKWLEFARSNKFINIEIRTKSDNYNLISDIEPLENAVLAWTLPPSPIAEKYEINAPSLPARLNSIEKAIEDGWKVRLCFDPILYVENYKEIYSEFFRHVFSIIDAGKITDASLGLFRMPSEYLNKIRKSSLHSDLIYYPFEVKNKVACYGSKTGSELINFTYSEIKRYIPESKIFNWE